MWKFCLLTIFWLVLNLLLSCSARGPVFPKLPQEKPVPLSGPYIFSVKVPFYKKNLLGGLFLEQSGSNYAKTRKSYFSMQVLGQNRKNSIRVRSYQGRAYQISPSVMELRAEQCYIWGKRDWEDKLIPLQRWDCDHLLFHYRSPSYFKERDILQPVKTERTQYTRWFSPERLIPIPFQQRSLKKKVSFAGQIIPLKESPKTNLTIVWGYRGDRLLRNGQILTAQDKYGKKVGQMKVVSRPGDFAICRWLKRPVSQAKIAYKP